MAKMNANIFIAKDYENETAFRPKKTNPKQTQFLQRPKLLAGKSGHTRSAVSEQDKTILQK